MSKGRGTVTDYAGETLREGDLVAYAARVNNRVRMTDAVIIKATAKKVDGRLRPMLLVEPTGIESGFIKRETLDRQWVSTEHVRLLAVGYAP